MKKLILVAIIFAMGWYGSDRYRKYVPGFPWHSSNDLVNAKKCITKDGAVIYGSVPPGTICERLEPVAGALTVVHVGAPAHSADEPTGSSDGSRAEHGRESSFHCDGRTYCSQMTSCAEAVFFLSHCPGVKMDGDGNGIPCEKQWCG